MSTFEVKNKTGHGKLRKIITVTVVILLILILCLTLIIAFNPIYAMGICLVANECLMDIYQWYSTAFYGDTVKSEDYIGGIPKNELLGKRISDISDKYNVLADQYDKNGNVTGRYYDISFAFFMLRDYESRYDRYVVYVKAENDVVEDAVLLNVLQYAMLSTDNCENYMSELSENEINAYLYWNGNFDYYQVMQKSKWYKLWNEG